MRKPRELHNFYKTKAWLIARTVKHQSANGRCERCNAIGEEVHHKIRLKINNVDDELVSLNQET